MHTPILQIIISEYNLPWKVTWARLGDQGLILSLGQEIYKKAFDMYFVSENKKAKDSGGSSRSKIRKF